MTFKHKYLFLLIYYLLNKKRLLFEAVAKNDMALITRFNDINIKDEKHNTSLYYATKYGFQNCCEYLLLKGADPNIKCEYGNTALH